MKTALYLNLALIVFLSACTVRQPIAEQPHLTSTVIVVHGLYANSGHVRPLKEGLSAQGFECLAPDLRPSDGSLSIQSLAQQLESAIDQLVPKETPLQLVGHSMGGLVALQYLQDPKNASRCRGLYTIASPHQGTLLASFHSGPAGRQMVSGSSFLQRLNSKPPSFPVTTYRGTRDLVIIPNSSSQLPFADNQVIAGEGHNDILANQDLLIDLTRRIQNQDRFP